ncbi:MAG: AMP-binding protein [Parvibaculaceae bacterium]
MNAGAGSTPEWLSSIRHDNDALALRFGADHALTYADLARRIELLAPALGEKKRLIAVEGRNSEHAIIAYLAAISRGHAVALLPPGRERLWQEFCEDFDPHLTFRERGGRWRLEAREQAKAELHPDLALLLATSGSEGRAKWVRLSAGNLAANARSIASYLGLAANDIAALGLPMHYSFGLSILNSHLSAKASVSIICKSIIDRGWLDDMVKTGCTNFSGVPHSYALLEQIGFRQCSHGLRFMTCAGGRLSPDLVGKYAGHMRDKGGEFFAMYGQTEATARMAYLPPGKALDFPDCIGIAIPGGDFHLIDEKGERIGKANEVGELVYSGPNVMMGYAATAADLRRGSEMTVLKTGDLALRTEAGLFKVTGRLKRFSKIAGIRVDHSALEEVCLARGMEAAVIGDDKHLTLFHASRRADEEIVGLASTATGLPARYFAATRIAALPRLDSGKVDYQNLKAEARSRKPRLSDRSVLDLFRESFHPKPVASCDTFRSLGGDSLGHVQLALDLEKHLGSLPQDWDRKTISALSETTAAAEPARIETSILLRALAILMVVIHHATLWPVPAGAAILLMLAGYGLARFHAASLFGGDIGGFLKSVLAKLFPFYLIVLGFAVVRQQVPWASVFLIGNLGFGHPDDGTLLPFLYWFVEAYAQIMLLTALLFSMGRIRTLAAKRPFETGLAALALAMALRIATPIAFDLGQRVGFNPTWLLFLVPLGWCAYFAATPKQKLVLTAAAFIAMAIAAVHGGGWTGSWVRYGLTTAGLVLLLFRPQIRFPRVLVWATLTVSAASFHIYLVHRLIPEAFSHDAMTGGLATTIVGLASGFAAFYLHRFARSVSLRRLGLRPSVALSRF